jgi:hypothetical protein
MDVPPPIYTAEATGLVRCHHGSVVLDMQCFRDSDNDFLLKEVCVIDVTTGTLILHHIARPPFNREFLTSERLRESNWLTRHCHGLEWDQGDIAYVALLDRLRSCLLHRPVVYVKGSQKREFVKRHLISDPAATTVQDMGDLGCGSLNGPLSYQAVRCRHHKSALNRCALHNCIVLRGWLMANEGPQTSALECFCCFRPR